MHIAIAAARQFTYSQVLHSTYQRSTDQRWIWQFFRSRYSWIYYCE